MRVYIIECVLMCILFTILTQGLLWMNPITFVSDYPKEIQEQYYCSQHKEQIKPTITKIMIVKKGIACILFVFLFAYMAHLAGAQGFVQGLMYAYGYILVLFAYDTFFLDWVLFANIKRFRLPGTENMDKEYHQKWFHVKACIPMIPVFLLGGIFVGLFMNVFF